MTNLTTRWLSYYVDDDMSALEARSELELLIQSDPRQAWLVISDLVARAPDDKTLGAIGAGPLETMLRDAGPIVIDWVVAEARTNTRFKLSLSHVWEFDIDDDIWKKVSSAFQDVNPTS
jgi:hypothetical protein